MKIIQKITLIIALVSFSSAIVAQSHAPHQPTNLSEPNAVEYFNNGIVKQSGFIINELNEGNWKQFYENGNVCAEGNYANGEKTGEWKHYDLNGDLIGKVLWVSDRAIHKEKVSSLAIANTK